MKINVEVDVEVDVEVNVEVNVEVTLKVNSKVQFYALNRYIDSKSLVCPEIYLIFIVNVDNTHFFDKLRKEVIFIYPYSKRNKNESKNESKKEGKKEN